jgi:hypothetical protein
MNRNKRAAARGRTKERANAERDNTEMRIIREKRNAIRKAAAVTIQRVVRGVQTRRFLQLEKLQEYFKKHHIHVKSFLRYIYEHGRRTLTKNMISYILMLYQNDRVVEAKKLMKLVFYGPQLQTFFKQHNDIPIQIRMVLIHDYIGACHKPEGKENAKEFISVLLNQLRLIADLYFKNENKYLSDQKFLNISWRNAQGMSTVMGASYGGLYGLMSSGTPMTSAALTGAAIGGVAVPLVKRLTVQTEYRQEYIKLLKSRMGNFPCLNNLLQEMLSVVTGDTFSWPWKTKNVGNLNAPTGGYTSKYLKIMMNSIVNIQQTDPTFSVTNNKFSKLNTNQQISAYWSKLKGQQMYKNGYLILVSNYNKNGKKFKNGYKVIMGN